LIRLWIKGSFFKFAVREAAVNRITKKEVLLGVFDGLPGLEEAFKAVYPKADVQRVFVSFTKSVTP
jgi:transposase-like protein